MEIADPMDPMSSPQPAQETMNPLAPMPGVMALDWISGRIANPEQIPPVCKQMSDAGWNVVSIVHVPGRLVGSDTWAIVGWRPLGRMVGGE